MRFYLYIFEKVNFNLGLDSDHPEGRRGYIVWKDEDNYTVKGKTHEGASHAIKHLDEFNPGLVQGFIENIQNFLGQTEYILKDTNKINNIVILNTLDRINDKIQLNEPLTPEEKTLKKWIRKFEKAYEKEIESTISQAKEVDPNNIPHEGVVTFEKQNRGSLHRFVLDWNRGIFIVMKGDLVRTAFRPDRFEHHLKKNNII